MTNETYGKRISSAEVHRSVGTSCFAHSSKVGGHKLLGKEGLGGCLNSRHAFSSQSAADPASSHHEGSPDSGGPPAFCHCPGQGLRMLLVSQNSEK